TEAMLRVVTSRRGTLYNAFSDSSLDFWGKTGTAECPGEDHALVIGFIRDPMPLAICVVIEHGGHGGSVAGPVVENILSSYLAERGEI
ncbi:MAG: penicillin-binding protein 2, partial [Candidatus Aegiribacteria sp.]|nr:penicillin-binding protein 2 [Candidatus Aegiribacteria sp.]